MSARRERRSSVLWSCVALFVVAGCGGPAPRQPGGTAAIVDLTQPGVPVEQSRFIGQDIAAISPGDFLELRILGFLELSGTFLVAQDGRINLGLIGSVMAAGKTADELDRELTAAYGAYFRNLDVAVNVNARAERWVYVFGEVSRPGRYDFRGGDRVVHALAQGGGMLATARESAVTLLRREADGADHVYQLDFGRLHDRVVPQDITLRPGDVIFVPKSRFRSITDFAKEFLDVLGRSATTTLVLNDLSDRTRSLTISN
jgi:polysaccharide export outer membrane protein